MNHGLRDQLTIFLILDDHKAPNTLLPIRFVLNTLEGCQQFLLSVNTMLDFARLEFDDGQHNFLLSRVAPRGWCMGAL